MDEFQTPHTGRTLILSLSQGELLLESIEAALQKNHITDAVVLSGIGTLDRCILHMVMTTTYPPVEKFPRWENQPLELASLQGYIADGKPHLHAVISNHQQSWAGHLEPNCRVLYLAEIVILELPGLNLIRHPDPKGIKHLQKK